MSIYRRVLLYYRPFVGPTSVALLFSFITVELNLLKPWPFKIIVDEILPHAGHGQLANSWLRLVQVVRYPARLWDGMIS